MPMNTHRTTEEIIRLVEDSKRSIRGNMAGPSTAAMTENVVGIHSTGREEDTSEFISSMAQHLEATKVAKNDEKANASRA